LLAGEAAWQAVVEIRNHRSVENHAPAAAWGAEGIA
jgi:hypothetical protein